MLRFVGEDVWTELASLIAEPARRRAAIAYVGREAPGMLPLGEGDLIIVDGSDPALAAGSTHPDAIAAWLAAKARVRSLPGLHAKVVLLENDESAIAVVGSANVSAHSRDHLTEAVIITDEAAVCAPLSEQLDVWATFSDPLDPAWVRRARSLFKTASGKQPRKRRQRPIPSRQMPLWVSVGVPTDERLSPAAQAAYTEEVARHDGYAQVDWWKLARGDENRVKPDQGVVLINDRDDNHGDPHGNSTAWPPAIVARVVPGSKAHPPVAVLVRDPRLNRLRFSDVRSAIQEAGADVNWDEPLPPGSVADAVRALWRVDSK